MKDDYFEREAIEQAERKKLEVTIKGWFSLNCLDSTVQLDGDYTSAELRSLADALDRMAVKLKIG